MKKRDLSGIYNTVIMKDVVERNRVRDPALLESVVKFVAAKVGNIVSTKRISDYLTSSGRKTTSETIDEGTRERELRPLQAIPDNYPKVILSMDKHIFRDFDGIECVNIVDFLLQGA